MYDDVGVPIPYLEDRLSPFGNECITLNRVETVIVPGYDEFASVWVVREPEFILADKPIRVVQREKSPPSGVGRFGYDIARNVALNKMLVESVLSGVLEEVVAHKAKSKKICKR